MELRPVYSSHVAGIGYDGEMEMLTVEYRDGAQYVYEGVPAEVADGVLRAPSIGEAMHASVRGRYRHRRVK